MSDWRHKDEWTKSGPNCLVKVSRHETMGENRWCLYAYLYPKHPHFSKFEGDSMWQDAANFFNWHRGCSYLEYHRDNKGEVGSVQVGCDYNHLYDDQFLGMATKDDAWEVFVDADRLLGRLAEIGAPE